MNLKEKINNSKIFNLKNTYIYTLLWFAITLLSFINPLLYEIPNLLVLYLTGGIIVISSHFLITPWLENRIKLVYEFIIPHVIYIDKIPDYELDTNEWINKVFHRDYTLFRILMLFVIFFGITIIPIILIFKFDLLLNYFPYLNYHKEKNLILLLITNIFGLISLTTLLYSYFRINVVLFGTMNILHHFTFWKLKENFIEEFFKPVPESILQFLKRISNEYFIQPILSMKSSVNKSIETLSLKLRKNSIATNKIIKNPLGELIILIVFILLLQTTILMNSFLGYVIPGLIYIISPVNPIYNYSKYIRKKYNIIFHFVIPMIFIISGIVRFLITPNLVNSFLSMFDPHFDTDLSFLVLLFQYILIILFYRTWYRFIKGKGVKPEEYNFDLKTPFERLCNRLKIKYNNFILIISNILLIFIFINLLNYYLNYHFLYLKHFLVLISIVLLSISMINLYFGYIKLKEISKFIGKLYYPYIRDDKKTESKYHFYEAFSSPQMIIFSYPFLFIFLIWSVGAFNRIMNTMPYLEINSFIRIPTLIIFGFLGLGFGQMIWCFYTAPHFAWHSMELANINEKDLAENQLLCNSKLFNKQFKSIILTTYPSIFLFVLGFYQLINMPIRVYLISFSFVSAFLIFMIIMYRKMIISAIKKKIQNILSK